jgi:hypothetical protein
LILLVVKAMALRNSAIATSVLSSCIICLFRLSYKILHPERHAMNAAIAAAILNVAYSQIYQQVAIV